MKNTVEEKLSLLIVELDTAIVRATENPLQFAEVPLARLEAHCWDLAAVGDQKSDSGGKNPPLEKGVRASREALLWQVRSRVGRLQMLLESATQFYCSCFSPSQPQSLAYGVQGEWSTSEQSGHLAVDC